MMNDEEYHSILDRVQNYSKEFNKVINDKFNKACGVSIFSPCVSIISENKERLEKNYPRDWQEAYEKYAECALDFFEEVEKDNTLPVEKRLYDFEGDEHES
jgi:hypothetical protein